MQTILDVIFQGLTILTPALILLLGNKLAGLRTKMIGWLSIINGGWAIVSTSLLPSFCEHLHLFCGFENNKTFGVVSMIVGFVINFIRQMQGGSNSITDLPARLVAKK